MQGSAFFVSRTSFWLLVPVVSWAPCPSRHPVGMKVCLMVSPFCIYLHTAPCFRDPLGWANNTVNSQSLLPSMATLDAAGILGLQRPYVLKLSLVCGLVTSFQTTTFLLWYSFTRAIALLIYLGSWHSYSPFSSDKKSASHGTFYLSFPYFFQ